MLKLAFERTNGALRVSETREYDSHDFDEAFKMLLRDFPGMIIVDSVYEIKAKDLK